MKKQDYNITGATGEFFVAAELSRREFIATLTLKNAPMIDVIATDIEKGISLNIQVKTRSERNKQGWLLGSKVEQKTTVKNHFYIFVNLLEKDLLPEYYVIPNNIFAEYQKKKHKDWMSSLGKNGQTRKDSSIRNFKPEGEDRIFGEKYKNNWQVLENI